MKKVWFIAVVVLFLASCATTTNVNIIEFKNDEELISYYEKTIPQMIEDYNIRGLSVAIVRDGQVFWSRGFGYSNLDDNIVATEHTVFATGSISKLFTGVAIMQLVEDGLIDLDASIKKYIPEFDIEKNYDEDLSITVRNLLTHHSGIPDSKSYNMFGDNDETFHDTVSYLNSHKTAYKPEEIWAYSNLAINLLGIIIENVSGVSFIDYMDENILEPLSMESSSFRYVLDNSNIDKSIVSMGYKAGEEGTFMEARFRDIPAGGLYSSVDDLTNFIKMILGKGHFNGIEILKEESLREMLTVQNSHIPLDIDNKMGLSFFLSESDYTEIEGYAGHGGNLIYHHCDLGIFTKQNIGAVVLTNTDSGSHIARSLKNSILKVTYKHDTGNEVYSNKRNSFKDAKKVKTVDESIVGDYSTLYGHVKVYKKGNRLKAHLFDKDFDIVFYDNGWVSLEYKLLGFIPYKNKFLKNLYFNYKNISNRDVVIVQNGDNQFIGGVKVEAPILDSIWTNRIGVYELINPDYMTKNLSKDSKKQMIFKHNGFLYLGLPKNNASMIIPSSENEMYMPYLGRRGFETLYFKSYDGQEILEVSGYKYRKIN